MQVSSVGSGMGMSPNSTYDSTRAAADAAKFSEVLEGVQRELKAQEAPTAEEKEKAKAEAKLREACQGFEAMFLQMMYRQMRSTVPENTLFGESNAMKIFQDMRDDELMKSAAASGGIGLGELLYQQLAPQVLAQAAQSK